MISCFVAGNYFLNQCKNEQRAITPMQLIKLACIANYWHLFYYRIPLIKEQITDKGYGPHIEPLYRKLKNYGGYGVTSLISLDFFDWISSKPTETNINIMESVWKSHCVFSGLQLSTLARKLYTGNQNE